jgi:hypothetical protein
MKNKDNWDNKNNSTRYFVSSCIIVDVKPILPYLVEDFLDSTEFLLYTF